MFISDDDDLVEALIDRLGTPLLPAQRAQFRQAALDALARVPCLGEGAAYRAVSELQRFYFDASDQQHARESKRAKLAHQPPIGRAREWVRARRAE